MRARRPDGRHGPRRDPGGARAGSSRARLRGAERPARPMAPRGLLLHAARADRAGAAARDRRARPRPRRDPRRDPRRGPRCAPLRSRSRCNDLLVLRSHRRPGARRRAAPRGRHAPARSAARRRAPDHGGESASRRGHAPRAHRGLPADRAGGRPDALGPAYASHPEPAPPGAHPLRPTSPCRPAGCRCSRSIPCTPRGTRRATRSRSIPTPMRRSRRSSRATAIPGARVAKATVLAAIERGVPPSTRRLPSSRRGRAASRIALRQLRQSGVDSPVLEDWERALERAAPPPAG